MRSAPAIAPRPVGSPALGLALAVLLALPFVAAVTSLDRLLQALGYDAALAAEIGRYLRAIAWGGPAFLGFAVLRSLLAALSHTASVMAVLLVCVAGNAVLNWVLIFGRLGAPALAVAGSGYASAINQWLMLAGLALCIRIMPGLAGLRVLRRTFAASGTEMANILRLGLPIGGIMGMEARRLRCRRRPDGLLGAAALGAHQLVLNCASITFMVPLGLGQASHGPGRPRARRGPRTRRRAGAGFVALALGIGFMGATAVVLWTLPRAIIAVYVNVANPANRETVEIARQSDYDRRAVPGV